MLAADSTSTLADLALFDLGTRAVLDMSSRLWTRAPSGFAEAPELPGNSRLTRIERGVPVMSSASSRGLGEGAQSWRRFREPSNRAGVLSAGPSRAVGRRVTLSTGFWEAERVLGVFEGV